MSCGALAALARARGGTTAVEFALVLPMFLMLVFGGIEFGRLLWMKEALQETAIAGARCVAIAQGSTPYGPCASRREHDHDLYSERGQRMGPVGPDLGHLSDRQRRLHRPVAGDLDLSIHQRCPQPRPARRRRNHPDRDRVLPEQFVTQLASLR